MKLRPILALLALLLALTPAGAPARPAHIAQPGLWKVADEDTTIYLFGTIHVLPHDYVWESAELKQVVARSDALMIETVIQPDPQKSAAMLLGMGRASGLPPLLDRVPPARKAALQSIITRSGLPPALLDGLKTWTAGLMLVAVSLTDLGLEPQSGVEEQLKGQFAASAKPIEGLEKPEEQLGFLDSLPETDQRAFLNTLIDDPAKGRKDFARMLASWSRGDEKAIARSFDKEEDMTPTLRAILLDKRNANWATLLADRMAKPGTILVAVGAGHLAGKDSVQAKLAARGFKVTRVE